MASSIDDVPFMKLKRYVIEQGVDKKEASNTTTKHALLALAEKKGVSIDALLAPGAAPAKQSPAASEPAKASDPARRSSGSAASELRDALRSPRSAAAAAEQLAAAEAKARQEPLAEVKAKRDAEEKVKREAEAKAKKEEEARARREAEERYPTLSPLR